MAAIVNLREESTEKLEERLENAREELFTLRFRHASSRLDDISILRQLRREIAQCETVLHMRDLAVNMAVQQPEIAAAVKNREWSGEAEFDYHDSAWKVEILDQNDKEIATALVDLNQKKSTGGSKRKRLARQQKAGSQRSPVIKFEIAG